MFTNLNEDLTEQILGQSKMAKRSDKPAGWGFTPKAESLNGRLAMFAFTLAIAIELITGQGVLKFLRLL